MKRPDTYDYHWSKTGETLKNPPYNNTRYSADQDKYIDYLEAQIKSQESDSLPIVSERYLLVEWLNGNPILDGATYFDSKEECLEYYKNLPKLKGFDIEHTICRISNAL
jgi:hypothetical protein